jgi:hypothetical protein
MSRLTNVLYESQEALIVALVYCLTVGGFIWMSASPAIG